MKIGKNLFLISSIFLTSCSCITSSFHYTKGTQCMERGDYDGAVIELNQAVELDPEFARNHSNLAYAYLQTGRNDKYWYHCRQAVLCPYKDAAGAINFAELCDKLIKKPGLNKPGTSLEEIIDNLGTPDSRTDSANGDETVCTYGTCIMKFKDHKLTSCKF
jgi:tetratricopeptide (TPR) repeat protein